VRADKPNLWLTGVSLSHRNQRVRAYLVANEQDDLQQPYLLNPGVTSE
jgi:hypothetical protein